MNSSEEEILSLEELNEREAHLRLPTIIYLYILAAIGITGNVLILTIYVIYGYVYKPNSFRCFIVTLASLDLLACCISIPSEIADNTLPYMYYAEGFCKFSRFVGDVAKLGSAFVLTVMAAGRYRKICFPFDKDMSLKTAKVLCVSAICLSISLSWPTAIIQGQKIDHFPGNITGYGCSTDDDVRPTKYPFIQATAYLIIFILVFCVLTFLYGRIIWELRDHFRLNRSMNIENGKHQKRHTATKIFLCITIAFIVSYIPHLTLNAMRTFKRHNILPPSPWVLGLLPLLSRSYFVNNVVNVFVYYLGDKTFRKQFHGCKICLLSIICKKKMDFEITIEAEKVVLMD